jgi:RNA polymerase sigma-70 factor, ECF subfamily
MEEIEPPAPELAAARKAFLQLVQELRPRLHRYCARMTGSALDGEDLVQETLATAYYKLSLMNRGAPMQAWLLRIAHNKCIDFLRAARPHEEWIVDEHDEAVIPRDSVERREDLQAALGRLVLLLPPMERACVILKDVLGDDLAGIAGTLGTSVGGVKAALHRGREKLRAASNLAPAPAHAPGVSPLLVHYVERFNARDWDGLVALLRADADCEVVGSWFAVGPEAIRAEYFGRYAGFEFAWRVSLGCVDGETVVVCWKGDGGRWVPRSLARVGWLGDRVRAIRDYIYIPYLLADANVVEIGA